MLSESEIKRLIDDDENSERKRYARIGQRYYDAEHDILQCRLFYYNDDGNLVEDTARSNIKIPHPFFTELSDQLAAFILSFDDNPIQAKDGVEGLQEYLDKNFDDEFWAECSDLITGTHSKGFDYTYGYKIEDGVMKFEYADGLGVVEVRESDTDDRCRYIIYHYIDRIEKGRTKVRKIQVWTEKETHYFVQHGTTGNIEKDKSVEINPRPHVVLTDKDGKKMGYPLGYIPFWRLDNNRKRISSLKPIKPLIDDYDLMQCGLSNNLVDFDTPLHVVKGYDGTDLNALQQNLKTKKIVAVDDDGGIQVQTVDIPYQARQAKAADDEKNIYRFGMGLNTSGLKDTAATTNIAIKAAYTLLELKAKKMEKQLKKLLRQLLKVVLADINTTKGTDYQLSDVTINFPMEIMTNETENIANEKLKAETKQIEVNTVLNVAAQIGDEQALKAICDVMDWDFEELKAQFEERQAESQSTAAAMADLEGVMTDEQQTETGTAAISE